MSQLPRSIDAAREVIGTVFGKKPVQDANVKDVWRNLERALGDRSSWTLATLRDLWGVLWSGAQKRRRSPDHERLFLSLCGFLLRPGFGAPLDQWRVEQTFGIMSRYRRLHRDYEELPDRSRSMIHWAMVNSMTSRLTASPDRTGQYLRPKSLAAA